MSSNLQRISLIIPVHNEAEIVESSLAKINSWENLKAWKEKAAFFIENGSRDNSFVKIQELEKQNSQLMAVHAFSEKNAGIGYAYARGAEEAINKYGASNNHWLLFTACDLPFDESDLKGFNRELSAANQSPIYIGSKSHKDSVVVRKFSRLLVAGIFRVLRLAILGMNVGDTQGTFLVRSSIYQELIKNISARDFSFTTELCYRAHLKGLPMYDVPVQLVDEVRPSTVRPVKDGIKVLKTLLRLRFL